MKQGHMPHYIKNMHRRRRYYNSTRATHYTIYHPKRIIINFANIYPKRPTNMTADGASGSGASGRSRRYVILTCQNRIALPQRQKAGNGSPRPIGHLLIRRNCSQSRHGVYYKLFGRMFSRITRIIGTRSDCQLSVGGWTRTKYFMERMGKPSSAEERWNYSWPVGMVTVCHEVRVKDI